MPFMLSDDADAHVVENERVWDYLDAADEKYRPVLVAEPDNPERQHWVLDGDLGPSFLHPTRSNPKSMSKDSAGKWGTPVQARELSDVTQRLRHVDALGIDVQVLYNSLWLRPLTRRPEVEIALCWSWNRWLADVWQIGELGSGVKSLLLTFVEPRHSRPTPTENRHTLRSMKLRSISLNSTGCSRYEKWPARLKIYIRESCVFRAIRSNNA